VKGALGAVFVSLAFWGGFHLVVNKPRGLYTLTVDISVLLVGLLGLGVMAILRFTARENDREERREPPARK
jgi:hypothetical protein